MYYREYPPHPALAAHVECMWAARVPAQAPGAIHTHRVLPDNCVDILWQDGGQPGYAVGMMSTAILVESAGGGQQRTVAVRFKPGAAGLFLGAPLHALTDQRADIDLLWGRSDAERLADALWACELSDRERISVIEHRLLLQLQKAAATVSPGDALVRAALRTLDASGGSLRIDDLALRLGVSRQHLAARFRDKVGLSPKLYARICRFRRATAALKTAPAGTPDWAQLALECGYFDQSHLIHDFQEFAGGAPQSFLLAR
jgi:AraC-like DNA-binding protein